MDKIIAARVGSQRWYEHMPRSMPLGVFLLAITATLLFIAFNEHAEGENRKTQSQAMASVLAAELGRRINTHTAYLRAVAVLLSQQTDITQREFDTIAHELSEDDEYRGSEGISWAQIVRPEALDAFVAARHAEGITDFTIHPAPPASPQRAIIPITYIGNPTSRMRLAYGYDTNSEIMRRNAMESSLKNRRPTATGPVRLAMDKGRPTWLGFLIYMPVFDHRSGVLRGYLGAPFNAGRFLDSALVMERAHDYTVALYDGSMAPANLLARAGRPRQSKAEFSLPIEIARRPMLLVVTPPPSTRLSPVSLVALALGSSIALLLAAVARMIAVGAAEDRASLAWLREQASIRGTLSRELSHRVKNTLANVLSILALTRRRATSLDDFADALEGRIRALSATHDLLIASNWGPTPLRAIITAELAPYTRDSGDESVSLLGPNVDLAPNDALSLGLALHELATNASKYGALSAEGGRVVVFWTMDDAKKVRVDWRETGGPPVPTIRPRGFGTELIERIVAHELGEAVELTFAESGVRCVLVLPVRAPAAFHIRARR